MLFSIEIYKKYILRQLYEISGGGFRVIKRKLVSILGYFFLGMLMLASLPIWVFIRLIKKWLIVRVGMLHSTRIGHYALNVELYLCETKYNLNTPKNKFKDLFFNEGKICNNFLKKKWKEKIIILPKFILYPLYFLNKIFPKFGNENIPDNTSRDRDVNNLLEKTNPNLTFSEKEISDCESILRDIGVPVDARIVTLINRDSEYLKQYKEVDWSYHNHRDCDVNNYKKTALYLANKGYYVIRMGAIVKEKFNVENSRVIDYANLMCRNEMLDIYLGYKSQFCISSSCGWDSVPIIFRKPVVYVNLVSARYVYSFRNSDMGIFKHHLDMEKNKKMTLTEILNDDVGDFFKESQYSERGIRLIENTEDEIQEVVEEFENLICGNTLKNKEEGIQVLFRNIFMKYLTPRLESRKIHGHFKFNCGKKFLENNPQWIA